MVDVQAALVAAGWRQSHQSGLNLRAARSSAIRLLSSANFLRSSSSSA